MEASAAIGGRDGDDREVRVMNTMERQPAEAQAPDRAQSTGADDEQAPVFLGAHALEGGEWVLAFNDPGSDQRASSSQRRDPLGADRCLRRRSPVAHVITEGPSRVRVE